MDKFIQMNEAGLFVRNDIPIIESSMGYELLSHLQIERGRLLSHLDEEVWIIEAKDAPLVGQALQLHHDEPWELHCHYNYVARFEPSTLSLDPWDRFHGITQNGVPFVLSASAQNQLFDLVDNFTDDSIIYSGRVLLTPPWQSALPELHSPSYWSERYQLGTSTWDLGSPAPALREFFPSLKLPRSRILVLGAGMGHDAVLLAQMGHLVTAVDFAPNALALAQMKYGNQPNLELIEQDIFHLSDRFQENFDVVLEHTCFSAIDPEQRSELVNVWRRCLAPGGRLLAIFFVHPMRTGPPFGASEWEIRQRLDKHFRFLTWQRIRNSVPDRLGCELWVQAQKR